MRVSRVGRLCAPWTAVVPAGGDPRTLASETDFAGGRAFLASLVVPGSGQWLRGQTRGYAYFALEAIGWAAFLHRRWEGDRFRTRYRDLAWTSARSRAEGPRIDGDFRYYEALSRFPASGAWDADPARSGLQPETDPRTYNGSVWSLAREMFLVPEEEPDSVARARALDFYREHGYPSEMGWDWSGRPGALDRYRSLIRGSDAAFREATLVLGVIVANHLVSAVDGFLSARLSASAASSDLRIHGSPMPRVGLRLHVDLPHRP